MRFRLLAGLGKSNCSQCGPGIGAPVKSLAACQRSFSQSDTKGVTTTEGGPRFPVTEAVTIVRRENNFSPHERKYDDEKGSEK